MQSPIRVVLGLWASIFALCCVACTTPPDGDGPATVGEEAPSALQVFTADSPSAMITIKLLFRVGSTSDPAGKEGLAALTGASALAAAL